MMKQNEPERSLYSASVTCLDLFDTYLKSPEITEERHDMAEELRGRFNLWAAYVGAFASPKASLDARLADHSVVRDMIFELLAMVERNLTHESSLSNFEARPNSMIAELNHDDPPLLLGLNAVEAALNRLHSLAVAIRRSAAKSYRQQVITNPSTANTEGLFYLQFVKLRFPHANDSLVEQVGTSIYIRGQSMYYQQRHNKKISESRRPVESEAGPSPKTEQELQSRPVDWLITSDTPKPHFVVPMSETNASKIDKEDLIRRITRPKRSFSQASRGSSVVENQDARCSYPKKPGAVGANLGTSCPLCFQPIDVLILTDKKWRNHVDQDMEPYICISERCRNSLQFFATSREWREHMQRMHTLDWAWNVHTSLWHCDLDHERVPKELDQKEFNGKDGVLQHLSNAHGESLSRAQIIARTRSGRTFRTRDAFTCPFCDCQPDEVVSHLSEKPYDLLSTHIAGHLKALAFISLSYLDFVEEYSDSSGSKKPSTTREGEATRSFSADRFDDIPPTLVSGNERYVEGQSFVEPDELDIPVIWPTELVPEFSGPDLTLERFAGVAKKRPPRKALNLEKGFVGFVNSSTRTLWGYNGLGEQVPFLSPSALSDYWADNAHGPELRKLSKLSGAGELRGYETVFSILVYIGKPELLYYFMNHRWGDAKLPMRNQDLSSLPPEALEMVDEFREHQWQFCPILFIRGVPKVLRDLDHHEILPIKTMNVLRQSSSSESCTIVCKVEYHQGYHDPSHDGTIVFREHRHPNDKTPLSNPGWQGRILSFLKSNVNIRKSTSSFQNKENCPVILEYGNIGRFQEGEDWIIISDDGIPQNPHVKLPSSSSKPKKKTAKNAATESSAPDNTDALPKQPSSRKPRIQSKNSHSSTLKQAHHPATVSFLFTVNELLFDYSDQDDYHNSVPPTDPSRYTTEIPSMVMRFIGGVVASTGYQWYRDSSSTAHTEGVVCFEDQKTGEPSVLHKYSMCAVFACNPLLPILICPNDPFANCTNVQWQLLQINHPCRLPGLSQVVHEDSAMPPGSGLRRYVAGSQPRWMPSLVPGTYRWPHHHVVPPPSAGLGGELAIVLGLMALTADADFSHQNDNIHLLFVGDTNHGGCWKHGKWSNVGAPRGHPPTSDYQPRGFLVTVFLDPENPDGSTVEALRWLEWDQPIVRD